MSLIEKMGQMKMRMTVRRSMASAALSAAADRSCGAKESLKRGFSLVELIVAVTILTVLTGAAAPSLSSQVEKQREKTCTSQRQEVIDAYNTSLSRILANASYDDTRAAIKSLAFTDALSFLGYTLDKEHSNNDSQVYQGAEGTCKVGGSSAVFEGICRSEGTWTADLAADPITLSCDKHDEVMIANDFDWIEGQLDPRDENKPQKDPDAPITPDTPPVTPDAPVIMLTVNPHSYSGVAGDTTAIAASLTGVEESEADNITWESSDDSIVSIEGSATGREITIRLNQKSASAVTIKASYTADGKEYTDQCAVTVGSENLRITPDSVRDFPGYETTLRVSTKDTGTVQWSSADESLVTVDSNGHIVLGKPEDLSVDHPTSVTAWIDKNGNGTLDEDTDLWAVCPVTVRSVTLEVTPPEIPNEDIQSVSAGDKLHLVSKTNIPTGRCVVEWTLQDASIKDSGTASAVKDSVAVLPDQKTGKTTVVTVKSGEPRVIYAVATLYSGSTISEQSKLLQAESRITIKRSTKSKFTVTSDFGDFYVGDQIQFYATEKGNSASAKDRMKKLPDGYLWRSSRAGAETRTGKTEEPVKFLSGMPGVLQFTGNETTADYVKDIITQSSIYIINAEDSETKEDKSERLDPEFAVSNAFLIPSGSGDVGYIKELRPSETELKLSGTESKDVTVKVYGRLCGSTESGIISMRGIRNNKYRIGSIQNGNAGWTFKAEGTRGEDGTFVPQASYKLNSAGYPVVTIKAPKNASGTGYVDLTLRTGITSAGIENQAVYTKRIKVTVPTVYSGEKGVHISYFEYLPLDEDNWQPYKWRTLKWESDDESIVSISADTNSNSTEKGQAGIIEGKGSGVAHVTVTAVDENGNIVKDADGNELKKVFTVTVTPLPVERVVVPGTDIQSVGTEELKTVLNSRMNGTTWSKWYHVGEIGMTNQNFPELYKTVIRDSSSGNLYMLSRRNQNPVYWPDDIATLDEYVAYCKQVKPKEDLFIPLQTDKVYTRDNAYSEQWSGTVGKNVLVQNKDGVYLVDGDTLLTPNYTGYDSKGNKLKKYSGEYKGLIYYNGTDYFASDAKISNSLPNWGGDWPPDPWFQIVSGPQYPDNGNYEFIK